MSTASADAPPGLSKPALHALADDVLLAVPGALERGIEFVLAETRGHWHNRARAMLCRRLKHVALSPQQSARLVDCITRRLQTGAFTEQFRDQLRLARHLDPARTASAAVNCAASELTHVRRLAAWVLSPSRTEP